MKKLFIIIAALVLTACHSVSYNTQLEDAAYIQFGGNYLNSDVQIGEVSFRIDKETETFELNGKTVAKFPVALGKHLVVVSKNNAVVVKKYIFVANGQTVEVNVP